MTLPARKEGIIPAMANLRLARFVGDRIARQAIMYERRIDCDSDVGRMICDEVVEPGEMDATIARVIDRLTGSGAVGAIGNRRALRLAAEPFDTLPPLRRALCPRAGLLPFQPGADLQPRAVLERAEPQGLAAVSDRFRGFWQDLRFSSRGRRPRDDRVRIAGGENGAT